MNVHRYHRKLIDCFCVALVATPLAAYASPNFLNTGSMNTSRLAHSATLLPNGRVLAVGGSVLQYGDYTSSAEIYNPTIGTWTNTGSLNIARYNHTATLLKNGKVLVTGGNGSLPWLASAELYDPATQKWVGSGSLNTGRELHTATLLTHGEVLVAGGYGNGNLASTELYDSSEGSWSNIGSLKNARYGHTATLLPNGKVLVAGGATTSGSYLPITLASAELYDPETRTWTLTGFMNVSRWQHTATLLKNGKVLVTGGRNFDHTNTINSSSEIFDPATGKWSPAGEMTTARYLHTATLLANGQVLVAGGSAETNDDIVHFSSAELYDPATKKWAATGSMNELRSLPTATKLKNGQVLVVGGGSGTDGNLSSAELYSFIAPTPTITLIKAVKPSFSNLSVGTSYQLQVSGDLLTWTNQGASFKATSSSMVYPKYWDVDNWGKLFFRIQ